MVDGRIAAQVRSMRMGERFEQIFGSGLVLQSSTIRIRTTRPQAF
jgi:phage-related protein